jgi:hypothetical protein
MYRLTVSAVFVEKKPITNFDIEALNALGGCLFDHAESIAAEILLEPVVADCLAAWACSTFASLRFRVAEIAVLAPQQNGSATARDLREALDSAVRMP